MDAKLVRTFQKLAGQRIPEAFDPGNEKIRELGARLLLTETLEYIIAGLGVVPEFNGVKVTDPESVICRAGDQDPDHLEMLDGLADVAYTMFWNSEAFGLKLEEAYQLVCKNNLEKFVSLDNWQDGEGPLERQGWGCGQKISWPEEVVEVSVLQVDGEYFAVGKDCNGKVRKPSSYCSVDLSTLTR
jgi:hypothetical protein